MATGLFNLKQVNQAISQGAWSGYIAPKWVEYLVVAGGGGAGRTGSGSGGGGAGGLLTGIVTVAAGTSYTVTVGAGGAGGSSSSGSAPSGSNSVFGSLVSVGGGGGGNGDFNSGASGGSGGGGSGSGGGSTPAGRPGQGTAGQGNIAGLASAQYDGGGGGGAGTAGLNGISAVVGGNGGAGIASSISGTVVTYAGGGGAGANNVNGGAGGVGGGGGAQTTNDTAGNPGSSNSGGGGSGGKAVTVNVNGGAGGSGIVVVRYPGNVQFFTGGTLSYANGYMIHTFYASGTLAPTTPTPYVTDYQISRSLRFNSADSAYLNRTPASATNQKTWTWSAWVKRGTISSLQTLFGTWSANTDAAAFAIYFNSGDTLNVLPWTNTIFTSTAVFRDPSAWYHIVVAFDSTQATASNRVIVYVNGVNQAGTYPLAVTQGANYAINSAQSHRLGDFPASGFNTFGGYMTEVNFIDGQALTPSSFGYTDPDTGVWSPLAFVGTYGTNGFYLNFSDNSNTTAATLGKDYSGNGNNWTPNNFSVTAGAGNDSLVDSPTSYGTDTGVGGTVRGNYCTLNPLYKNGLGTPTYSNGNLDMLAGGSAGSDSYFGGTFSINSGKWYYECTVNTIGTGGAGLLIGICKTSAPNTNNVGSYRNTSEIYNLDGNTQTAGATYTTGDIIGVAFDIDAGTVQFYKNGTAQGATPSFTFTAGTEVFVRGRSDGPTPSATLNFGQRPFAYTAPSGYKALCTQNLPTPTIGATTATQAGKYFNPVLYTGNRPSTNAITGVGFQPDFTWIKQRNGADDHTLYDAVRGATKALISDQTIAEFTYSGLTSFDSDGFTMGGATTGNASGGTFVAWNWKANGSGSTNTAGFITSTVSANTTSGFSVVTYTGNGTGTSSNGTVGHGLGVVPSMIIIKRRDNTGFWYVATKDGGTSTSPTYSVFTRGSSGLNQTGAAFATAQTYASSGYITSSTFNLYWLNAAVTAGDSYDINYNTGTYVAYCFAEVAGYSKFGSYTGNGSTDGPFVFTGMRPAYIMFKRTNTSGTSWNIFDTSRSPYNVTDDVLFADLSNAEVVNETTAAFDILSNGFKLRTTGSSMNGSGDTFIFMAFASAPFKYSLAR